MTVAVWGCRHAALCKQLGLFLDWSSTVPFEQWKRNQKCFLCATAHDWMIVHPWSERLLSCHHSLTFTGWHRSTYIQLKQILDPVLAAWDGRQWSNNPIKMKVINCVWRSRFWSESSMAHSWIFFCARCSNTNKSVCSVYFEKKIGQFAWTAVAFVTVRIFIITAAKVGSNYHTAFDKVGWKRVHNHCLFFPVFPLFSLWSCYYNA